MQEPQVYISRLNLYRYEEQLDSAICFCSSFPSHYHKVLNFLHPQEQKYYDTLKAEKRKRSYLIGRYTAKKAVAVLIGETNLKNIIINQGVFKQPVVSHNYDYNIQVSISHCDNCGVAIAFPEVHPMGIDIEKVSEKFRILKDHITKSEKKIMSDLINQENEMFTLFWTIKESLSKVLKTGLMTPLQIYEIAAIHQNDFTTSYYKNFAQYKCISLNLEQYICSITCPKNTELHIDVASLKQFIVNVDLDFPKLIT